MILSSNKKKRKFFLEDSFKSSFPISSTNFCGKIFLCFYLWNIFSVGEKFFNNSNPKNCHHRPSLSIEIWIQVDFHSSTFLILWIFISDKFSPKKKQFANFFVFLIIVSCILHCWCAGYENILRETKRTRKSFLHLLNFILSLFCSNSISKRVPQVNRARKT